MNWNLLSKIFGYSCGALIVIHTFFSVEYGENMILTIFEIMVLIVFLVAELMVFLKKREERK